MIFIWYMAMFGLRVKLRAYIMFSLGRNVDMVPKPSGWPSRNAKTPVPVEVIPASPPLGKAWSSQFWDDKMSKKKWTWRNPPRQASTSLDFISNLEKRPAWLCWSFKSTSYLEAMHASYKRACTHTQTSMCVCVYLFIFFVYTCAYVRIYIIYIYDLCTIHAHGVDSTQAHFEKNNTSFRISPSSLRVLVWDRSGIQLGRRPNAI